MTTRSIRTGFSTSLPEDVQEAFIRKIHGLEKVEIKRFGYAIEYDYVDPRELDPTLAVKRLPGCTWQGRSMARRAMKRLQDRAWWRVSTRRVLRRGAILSSLIGRARTLA